MQPQERHYRRRGGFAWPLILISLGVILLLNNIGVLSWGVWDTLWRLWPVLLIAIGLDILFGGRSALGSLVAFVVIAAVIAGTFWFSFTKTPIMRGDLLTTDRIVQEMGGATSADVRIGFGVGRLRLGALKDSGNLIEGTVVSGQGETVLRNFSMDGNTARFELRNEGVPIGPWPWGHRFDRPTRTWTLDLSSSVPLSLDVSTGVGESMLDLSALRVTDLRVNSGVGEIEVRLPARGQMRGKVSGGVGQLTVVVPEGVAARIHASAGLGGISTSGRFRHQDRYYTVGDYAGAENRIDLDISGGIGQVVIR